MTESARPMPETNPASFADPGSGPPPLEPPAEARKLQLQFTGTGGEYFRIWVVIAGRISIEAAVVAAVVLALLAPWLFFMAMRFKLSNTTWRGVRFGFDSTVGAAYGALAPAVILWIILAVEVTTLRPGEKPSPGTLAGLLAVYGLFLVLVPLLHARIKRYQHRATTWGTQKFDFEPSTGAFYALYGKTFLVALLPFLVVVGATVAVAMTMKGAADPSKANAASIVPILAATYAGLSLAYLAPGAFFSARLQRLVWTRTHGGPFTFSTSVRMRGMLRVWVKNGLLTLLTLGLYWPYAAVHIARYKIECMTVEAAAPLDTIAAAGAGVESSAAGDGAVDFFGWDLGL